MLQVRDTFTIKKSILIWNLSESGEGWGVLGVGVVMVSKVRRIRFVSCKNIPDFKILSLMGLYIFAIPKQLYL